MASGDGEDLDSARATGAEGQGRGRRPGRRRGGLRRRLVVGFRTLAYDAMRGSYKEAYRSAFEDAGLDLPELADIEVDAP